MSDTAKRFRVTGRVQGVAFRAWTQEEARALGLRGWVRNEPDRSVAGVVIGPQREVTAFLAALEDGPPAAAVAEVGTEDAGPEDIEDAGDGFHVTG